MTYNFFSRKCCAVENNISETLKLAKAQCLVETRKSRKPYNESEDFIDGDGELYTMFSCDRIKRWKTFVTCTIECIAQKVGMVNKYCSLLTTRITDIIEKSTF